MRALELKVPPLLVWVLLAALGVAIALAALPAFFAYPNRFKIGPEGRVLAAKFGPAYASYRGAVRRWI